MYYEIYVDSLFVLQLSLNFYLLESVNYMLYRAMSHTRILLGAALGAVCSLIPFMIPMKLGFSMVCSFSLSFLILCIFTFRTYKKELLLKILEKMITATLLLGGLMVFLIRIIPQRQDAGLGVAGILGLGGVCLIITEKLLDRKRPQLICKVILQGENTITVNALMDTGNSLTEPISGKPVCVLDQNVFEKLYKTHPDESFRMIPYHSIGRKRGIMPGYLIKTMIVEMDGVRKECHEVYLGIGKDMISEKGAYEMILNPRLLQ